MGIFDDVVVNAKSAAQTVGKMAGQFVDMSKLRINMAELNGEITKRYQELGRFIYEAKKAGSADEAELADQIAGIDDLYAQLSAVSAQYAGMWQEDADGFHVLQPLRRKAGERTGRAGRSCRSSREGRSPRRAGDDGSHNRDREDG